MISINAEIAKFIEMVTPEERVYSRRIDRGGCGAGRAREEPGQSATGADRYGACAPAVGEAFFSGWYRKKGVASTMELADWAKSYGIRPSEALRFELAQEAIADTVRDSARRLAMSWLSKDPWQRELMLITKRSLLDTVCAPASLDDQDLGH